MSCNKLINLLFYSSKTITQGIKLTTNYTNGTNYIAIILAKLVVIKRTNHKVNYELRQCHE
mgnify:CR=1